MTQPSSTTPSDTVHDEHLPTDGADGAGGADRLSVDGIRRLTDRRGVLKAVGVVAGVGALAACSSPAIQPENAASSSAATTPSSAASTSTSAAAETSTPAETSSSAETTSAAAGGTPTSEIPVGGGKIYSDTKTVVTQPEAGTFKAFDVTCPHQGCPVSKIADGRIDCMCHGSQFDLSTGDRVAGPAQKGLTAKKITVSGDSFTVA